MRKELLEFKKIFAKNLEELSKKIEGGNITSSLTQSIDTKIFGEIFFLDILYTFSKNNNEDKNLIVGQTYYIYNRYNMSSYLNISNRFYLKSTLIKIINCNYLSDLNMRKIKKLFRLFFI